MTPTFKIPNKSRVEIREIVTDLDYFTRKTNALEKLEPAELDQLLSDLKTIRDMLNEKIDLVE